MSISPALALMIALSPQADPPSGGGRSGCSPCGTEFYGNYTHNYEIVVLSMGDWVLDSATGTAVAYALTHEQSIAEGCCVNPGDCGPIPVDEVDTDGRSDNGDLIPCLSADAETDSATSSEERCGLEVEHESSQTFRFWDEVQFTLGCDDGGYSRGYKFGAAWAASGGVYYFSGGGPEGIQYRQYHTFDIDVHMGDYGLTCDCNPSPLPAYLAYCKFRSAKATATDGEGPQVSLKQGLIAGLTDGTVIRLGVYDHASLAPTPTAYGYTISGTRTIDVSFSSDSPDTIEFEDSDDAFSVFDGDADRDGIACWSDRMAMSAAMGGEINASDNYNPRCDFNLDGVIDGDDVDAMNNICKTFDFNCDGFFNGDDEDEFLIEYMLGAPIADADMNGFVNGDDFDLFEEIFIAGCA